MIPSPLSRRSARFLFLVCLAAPHLPRVAPCAAGDLSEFQLHPDFRLERVAAEPVVMDPVDVTWDERGRMFVIEMPGYPTAPLRERPWPGRVVLIEDTDGDGAHDRRTVFADDFRYADAILAWGGGLLVADPPDLTFLRDTDGDDVADVREAWFEGFAVGNPQHNFGGLTLGPDGWIYGSNGGNNGRVSRPDDKENRVSIGGFDFRFHPITREFGITGRTSGGYGLGMDDYGNLFTTENTQHVHHIVLPQRYLDRNPHLPLGATLNFISDHDDRGLGRIYPVGTPETRVNHPEQSGYFSGACGISYYGGGVFGPDFGDALFIPDVVTGIVHRDMLTPDGSTFTASRAPEESAREFLACSDRSFRPVNCRTGPEGALYVIDFNRVVIEHPEWIPDELEKDMDLEGGKDRGRIYRILPKAGLPRTMLSVEGDTASLVRTLEHRNRWHRDTAQRLLVEARSPEAPPLLVKLARESEEPRARFHAIHLLAQLGELTEETVTASLADPHPGVRGGALVLAEPMIPTSPAIRAAVLRMADDPDPRVRMQTALALGEFPGGARGDDLDDSGDVRRAFLAIAARDIEDEWTRRALLSGVGARAADILTHYVSGLAPGDGGEGRAEFVRMLSLQTAATGDRATAADMLARAAGGALSVDLTLAIIEGVEEGIGRSGETAWRNDPPAGMLESADRLIATDDPRVLRPAWKLADRIGRPLGERQKDMLERAARIAADPGADPAQRIDQLALLEFAPFERRADVLFGLLGVQHPREVQLAALDQLGRGPNDRVARRLLDGWKALGPVTRPGAGNILLYRRENNDMLLSAIESGDLSIGQFNFDLERRRHLLRSPDAAIRDRAAALFSDAGVVTRAAAMERMRPALSLAGDAEKGREVFKALCLRCHRFGGEGAEVGPNLTEISRKSPETILHDILDPNAAADIQYLSFTIVTTAGEVLSGLLHAETPASVTLRAPETGDRTLPRTEIKEMYSGGLSLMPEELETDMEPQTMADLLAYLRTTP